MGSDTPCLSALVDTCLIPSRIQAAWNHPAIQRGLAYLPPSTLTPCSWSVPPLPSPPHHATNIGKSTHSTLAAAPCTRLPRLPLPPYMISYFTQPCVMAFGLNHSAEMEQKGKGEVEKAEEKFIHQFNVLPYVDITYSKNKWILSIQLTLKQCGSYRGL